MISRCRNLDKADTFDSCIRSRPDRVIGLAVPGTAFRAYQMHGHLRHRHALRQPQYLGIEIRGAAPVGAALNLQELALAVEVANRHRLEPERLRLAPAPGLVPVLLQLHKLGKPGNQLGDAPRLVIGHRLWETLIAPSGWP